MLKIHITKDPQGLTVALDGTLDESSQAPLQELLVKASGAARCVLDCGGIANINSVGLRNFSNFTETLIEKTDVNLTRCSVVFIDYANLVPELITGCTIHSFFAPYRCAPCARNEEKLLEVEAVRARGEVPPHGCGKCGQAMELEVHPSEYLEFLGRRGRGKRA